MMRQDFFNLEIETSGQKLYQFTDRTQHWIKKNNFNNDNSNQQQRFITLIDILYEKKLPLMISSESQLKLISSSKSLENAFKRTISRLYELTSINYDYL